MNEKIEKIKVEKFLNDNMEHQDKKIDYILYKPDKMETNILASNYNDEVYQSMIDDVEISVNARQKNE